MTELDQKAYTGAMDDYRSRPGDELVEPLFAGLGVSEDRTASAPPGRKRVKTWVAVLVAGTTLLTWWLR